MIDYQNKFSECLKEIEKLGIEYAEHKAQSWYMQEMRKAVLADLMKSCEGKSVSEKEMNARSSLEYKNHLEGTKTAIFNEQKSKSMYDKAYARYEALRSLSSQQTASLRMGV